MKTVDFSETIAACDLKVGRCRQLIEFMEVYVDARHFAENHFAEKPFCRKTTLSKRHFFFLSLYELPRLGHPETSGKTL